MNLCWYGLWKLRRLVYNCFLMHQRNIKRKRNNNDKKRQKIIFIFFNVIERFTNSNSSTLARVNLNLPKQCMFTPLTVKMNRNEESHPQWIKSSLDYIFIHILMLVKRVKIFCVHESPCRVRFPYLKTTWSLFYLSKSLCINWLMRYHGILILASLCFIFCFLFVSSCIISF